MATLNVYIPDALREEMDTLEQVNWSGVAQEAFRSAIKLEKLKMVDNDLAAGLERLRQSRAANGEELFAKGWGLGKQWALEAADFAELERVARAHEAREFQREDEGRALIALVCAIDDTEGSTVGQVEEMTERLFGEGYSDQELDRMVAGFAEGAVEIFGQL